MKKKNEFWYKRAFLCYLTLFVEVDHLLMAEQLLMLGKDIRVDTYALKKLSCHSQLLMSYLDAAFFDEKNYDNGNNFDEYGDENYGFNRQNISLTLDADACNYSMYL